MEELGRMGRGWELGDRYTLVSDSTDVETKPGLLSAPAGVTPKDDSPVKTALEVFLDFRESC